MRKKILLTITLLALIGVAVLTYRTLTYNTRMDELGYELMQKIDSHKEKTGFLPKDLSEIGIDVDDECYHYKGGIFYYTILNDSIYCLEYPLDAENNRGITSDNRIWTENYVLSSRGLDRQ